MVVPPALFVADEPGDLIGRYKLLEKLGEGGCGVVYVAEQSEPVRRRVALKVIKLALLSTFHGHSTSVTFVAFFPNGERIVTAVSIRLPVSGTW